MTTGWDMLPDTAKALSAPITKMIEVVAAGCGRIYGPTDIRRRADAEGDALVLMEDAKGRASEIAVRAAQRILDVETRRQENLEAIVEHARLSLPDEVSAEPVEADWAARFFREAQDIGNDEMRRLWGKLLAGEVAKPGTFSARTLGVVADLSLVDANLFEAACSLLFSSDNQSHFFVALEKNLPHLVELGITFVAVKRLEAAGLMNVVVGGVGVNNVIAYSCEAPGDLIFQLEGKAPMRLDYGSVLLTPAGAELASIAGRTRNEKHVQLVADEWKEAGWTVTTQRIVKRDASGLHVASDCHQY